MAKQFNILTADFETTTLVKKEYETYKQYRERLKNNVPYVYSWALCEKKPKKITTHNKRNYDIKDGIDVFSFLDTINNFKKDYTIYFHNGAKFDLHFILPYLEYLGYKQLVINQEKKMIDDNFDFDYGENDDKTIIYEQKPRLLKEGEYTILVDKAYRILEMKLCIKDKKRTNKVLKNRVVIFRDSNLMFPSSLKGYGETLAKHYNDDRFLKQELQNGYTKENLYNTYNEFLNDGNEREYLHNDTIILNEFLHLMSEAIPFHKWKITSASTAYNIWKYDFFGKKLLNLEVSKDNGVYRAEEKDDGFLIYKTRKNNKPISYKLCINKLFDRYLPIKWLDTNFLNLVDDNFNYIHEAYQGGLTMANAKHAGKIVNDVIYIDINSSYPTQMKIQKFPYGVPVVGDSGNDDDLKIYNVKIDKVVNKKGLPFLYDLLDISSGKHYPTTLSNKEFRLTDIELERMKKYYKGKFTYEVGVSFNSIDGNELFGDYVDYFYKIKSETKNIPLKIYAKLMLNSLYGKFGQDIARESKFYYNSNWYSYETLDKPKFYLPIAIYMTAYARMYMVDAVDKKYENVVGLDTDSLSLKVPKDIMKVKNKNDYIEKNYNVKLHPSKLGYWDIEYVVKSMLFRRAKQYFFIDENDKKHLKYAGLRLSPKETNDLTYNDVIYGKKHIEQLRPFRTPAGLYLESYEKELKPIWDYKLNPDYWFKDKKTFEKNKNNV